MADRPIFLYAAIYDDLATAEADYEAVFELHAAGAIGTFDSAVIYKDDEGKVHVSKTEKPTQHGAWTGAGVGALVGLLFPPALIGSAVVGAGAGGLIGHLRGGVSRGDLKDLGEELKQGSAAVIVLGESRVEEQLEKAVARANKMIEKQIDADADELRARSTRRPRRAAPSRLQRDRLTAHGNSSVELARPRHGCLVDRDPVLDRLDLLPGRAAPGIRPAGRLRGRRDCVIRRFDLLHVGGVPAVLALRRKRSDCNPDPAHRDAVLQRQHVSGNAGSYDTSAVDRLVWRPEAIGSACFLISGVLAYLAVRHHRHDEPAEWRIAAVNLAGCVLFGVAAIAGYIVPSTGTILDLAAANWSTSLGALCFLVGALMILPRFASVLAASSAPSP